MGKKGEGEAKQRNKKFKGESKGRLKRKMKGVTLSNEESSKKQGTRCKSQHD